MSRKGWITAEWKQTENNRRAKFYSLTHLGRKQLESEAANWRRLSSAISHIVHLAEGQLSETEERVMRWKHWRFTAPLRLRSVRRRPRVEQELDEELQFHLECKIAEGIASGLSPKEARYTAMRSMDGLEQRKEEMRDTRRIQLYSSRSACSGSILVDLRAGT